MLDMDHSFRRLCLGFFLGLAVILPGINASSIAIMLNSYDKILYAISNITKKFKLCFLFLFPIFIGAILGLFVGFFLLQSLYKKIPFAIISLFGGMMLGTVPSLKKEVDSVKLKGKNLCFLIIGIMIPLVSLLGCIFFMGSEKDLIIELNIYDISKYFLLGVILAITQLIPGCSATAILITFGYFTPLLNSLCREYIGSHPSIIAIYGLIFIGACSSILIFSKGITNLLEKNKTSSYFLFIGLTLSTVVCLYINPDMEEIYQKWMSMPTTWIIDFLFGMGLFFSGIKMNNYIISTKWGSKYE